nr:hypothetical protein [Tanacetum cinerariifolium]
MRLVPTSLDRTPALYVYPLNCGDVSRDEDLSDTTKSLHIQSASTSVVHTSPIQSLPTSLVIANQPKKEIPMPLGYKLAMNQWRVAPSSTGIHYFHQSYHPLLVRSRPLPPSLPPLVPPPEHIESLRDNIKASIWNLERNHGP